MPLPASPERLYFPVLKWLRERLEAHSVDRPLFLGINGPQGSGKTTLADELVRLLAREGRPAISLSIDDFYFTRAQQIALAARYPQNPLLQQRGYPGTHDIALGESILAALQTLRQGSGEVLCPVYDKSACGGQGDRAPSTQWKRAVAPLDVVILDGWMLGFTPVAPQALPCPAFEPINRFLEEYAKWVRYLDAFLQLEPQEIRSVIDWRIEAEEHMKAQGKPGMSRDEIRSYIENFIPAYETYLPPLSLHPPQTPFPPLKLTIGPDRLPIYTPPPAG